MGNGNRSNAARANFTLSTGSRPSKHFFHVRQFVMFVIASTRIWDWPPQCYAMRGHLVGHKKWSLVTCHTDVDLHGHGPSLLKWLQKQ